MSEDGVHMGWQIALKGWENMITRPRPYYAHTQAELDWYLKNYGPADKYDITRAPDPLTPDIRADLERRRLEALATENTPQDTA